MHDIAYVPLFAHDNVIYHVINSDNDASQLHWDLDALQDWERKWLMEFYPEKCQLHWITKRLN